MSIFCYQHHINDWRTKTAGLSLEEKGAYREMMDWFYALEGKLPADQDMLCRVLGVQTQSERNAIASVSQRFWTCVRTCDGHEYLTQKRALEELERIKIKSKKAAEAAAIRHNKDLGSADADADADANAMLTNNQEPLSKIESKGPDGFDEFWEGYPRQRRGSKDKAVVAYRRALTRATKDEINGGARRYAGSDEVARGFAKGAAAWLNDDRWGTQYRPANGGSDPGGGPTGQGRASGNGREPRGVVAAALRVAARLEGKEPTDG